MGLETVQYIDDFVVTNPTPQDKRREGDDHLRRIKLGVKNTFPNLNGPVTATPTELNYTVGVTSNIQDQLDSKLESTDLDFSSYAQLSVDNAWTSTQTIAPVNLGNVTDAAVMDLSVAESFIMTIIGNVILNFTNLVEGQNVFVKIIQGIGGSHTIEFLGNVHFPFGLAPTLSTTAGSYDVLSGKVIDGAIIFGLLSDLR